MSPSKPIEVRQYTKTKYSEITLESFLASDQSLVDKNNVTWIDVTNHENLESLLNLDAMQRAHPILLDNLRLVNQRSKLEIHEHYAYILAKLMSYKDSEIIIQQLSILFFKDMIITISESPHNAFDEIKERLKNPADAIRRNGQDFLLYVIFDDLVDDYNQVLDEITEAIDEEEVRLLKTPTLDTMKSVQEFKKGLYLVYRSVWPIREILNRIVHGEVAGIGANICVYHRDVLDHLFQVLDVVDLYREIVSSMMDVYLSSISIRMNEIMKVLTIISTIFIPLTFIVGVYGMNFKYMPELYLEWTYPLIWLIMIGISVGMLVFFKRKKWL